MSQDTRSPSRFDAFGEAVDALPADPCGRGDRVARRVGAAIFWTLAALILYGRIHLGVPADGPGLRLAEAASATSPLLQ